MTIPSPLPTLDQTLNQTLERMSDLFHLWGFKRIHGKIWALLALSKRPLDAADLIRKLDISKALVSISIRELLEIHAVLDVGKSSRATRLYEANLNLQEIAYFVLKTRELVVIHEIQSALEVLREAEPAKLKEQEIAPEKLQDVASTLKTGADSLSLLISSLQLTLQSQPSSSTRTSPSSEQVASSQELDGLEPSYTLAKPEFEP